MNTRRVGVTIVHSSDPLAGRIGGIESFISDFIGKMPEDFDVDYVGLTSDPAARPVGRWQASAVAGRPVRILPVASVNDPHRRSRVPVAFRLTAGLMRYRDRIGIGRRVLQFHRPGVALPLLRSPAAKIRVVHLTAALDIGSPQSESRWSRAPRLFQFVESRTLRRMDRVFCVNGAVGADYRARFPAMRDRIFHLPTWADEELFTPAERAERSELRERLEQLHKIPAASRLLLFVGRLERIKDPGLLVETFARAAQSEPGLVLAVAGDGSERGRMVADATARGIADRVFLLGRVPRADVATIMRAADALLLTSVSEAMPLTVVEAMSTGLPVVSTDVGAVGSVVRHRHNGWISAERTSAGLADGIAWLASQPEDTLRSRAVAGATPYSARAILPAFYQAHRDLLAPSR